MVTFLLSLDLRFQIVVKNMGHKTEKECIKKQEIYKEKNIFAFKTDNFVGSHQHFAPLQGAMTPTFRNCASEWIINCVGFTSGKVC